MAIFLHISVLHGLGILNRHRLYHRGPRSGACIKLKFFEKSKYQIIFAETFIQ